MFPILAKTGLICKKFIAPLFVGAICLPDPIPDSSFRPPDLWPELFLPNKDQFPSIQMLLDLTFDTLSPP